MSQFESGYQRQLSIFKERKYRPMFHSVSGKAMTINEIANRIIQYMMEDINASYEIIDSK